MPTLIESWHLKSGSAHCDQELEKEHSKEEAWRTEEYGEELLHNLTALTWQVGKLDMVPGCSPHG